MPTGTWRSPSCSWQKAATGHQTAYTLARVLDIVLRLLHPFTPFVTEELWGHLKQAAQQKSGAFAPAGGWEDALIVAKFPEPRDAEGWEAQKIADFGLVQEIVRSIRNLRTEKKGSPRQEDPRGAGLRRPLALLDKQGALIAHLAGIDPAALVMEHEVDPKPSPAAAVVVMGIEMYLPLAGMVDTSEERARLEKDLADTDGQIERLEKLLGSSFAEKAPAAVVEKERQKLATYRETAARLKEQIEALG